MKNPLNVLKMKSEPQQIFDTALQLIENEDWSELKQISNNTYATKNASVSVKYFVDTYEEIQISFGYAFGNGMMIVLRSYIEDLVVINHEILEKFHTIEFPLSPESLLLRDYKKKFDAIAIDLMDRIEKIK